MRRRLYPVLALLALPLLAPAQSPLDGLSEAVLAEGEKAYRVHCARCHGIAGEDGEGANLVRAKLKYAADDQALRDDDAAGAIRGARSVRVRPRVGESRLKPLPQILIALRARLQPRTAMCLLDTVIA